MKTIELSYPHSLQEEDLPAAAAAIGFFDGIHQGHQKVIQAAVKQAKSDNMESVVITFHPHPSVVLKGEKDVQYITPLKEKQKILQKMNVDRLYIIKFTKELSLLSPEKFINHFITGLNIKHLVAGFDFTFGHMGKGNMENIHMYTQGSCTTEVIEKVSSDQEKISSTRIRQLLEKGNVEETNILLGRSLRLTGTVVDGDKRGRTIGYPTANLDVSDEYLMPAEGVYAVEVLYKGVTYQGMANLGTSPTFVVGDVKPKLEVNILDYENNLYGEKLEIIWNKFIREEVRFNSVEELINEIEADEVKIRQYFSDRKKR